MKGQSVHVVFNAGAGSAAKLGVSPQSLLDRLRSAGAGRVEMDADAARPLDDRVRAAASRDSDIVLAAGGDGTVTAVASGLVGRTRYSPSCPSGPPTSSRAI
jgi:diacylglycerol kinase family enzyme